MARKIGLSLFIIFSVLSAIAQDTLPRFTLVSRGSDRVIISWTNPYGASIKQLSIQRSFDSTKNFKTILTLPDPAVPQNGYVDSKFTNNHMFYRLYIQLDSGKYLFSKARRPVPDTAKAAAAPIETKQPDPQRIQEEPKPEDRSKENLPLPKPPPGKTDPSRPESKLPPKVIEAPERIIYIKKRDSLISQVGEKSLKRFKDSIAYRTKDTLTYQTADTIMIRPFVPKEVYKPSRYVFTEKDGNVRILLPDAAQKKYIVKFFEDNGTALFDIKQIKDTMLVLEKTNFVTAGWYRFELYEDGQLKERHKLFIPKDF